MDYFRSAEEKLMSYSDFNVEVHFFQNTLTPTETNPWSSFFELSYFRPAYRTSRQGVRQNLASYAATLGKKLKLY